MTYRLIWAAALLCAALIDSIASAQAAGALAIGQCGAYGFAYDYAVEAAASRAALENAQAAARLCR
jgi:hypothetical protein